ncbi:MAG: LuxR family transcriptional regulator [Corynebacteriales bacterium]|nr:LuxR family transcriptional regulator [Mycobacteriales bacterium]
MPHDWAVVGREGEISAAREVLDRSDVGGVVLSGAAGVGKSCLAREIARRAGAEGWTVRTVAATGSSRAVPLGAFARWTDDRAVAPAAMVRRIADAVTAAVPRNRLLLLVDDAHLLDDLSALVVAHLAESGATVLLTVRSGEPVPAAISALWKERRVVRRDVDVLSSALIGTALESAFGAPPDRQCSQRFWELTRGNMLYVRQLADQETDAGNLSVTDGALRWEGDVEVGGSLAEIVETHIGTLAASVRDLVDLVSVSEPVELVCVTALAEQSALEEAEQRGLIRIVDGQVFAGHPLFAEIRRERCGSAKLRRLRGQVALTMGESRSAATLVKRGLLWIDSDLAPDRELLTSAATAANSLLDFDIAERLFAAAAEAGSSDGAYVSRALALFMMSEGESADAVLAHAPSAGDVGEGFINDVVMRASNALWSLRTPDEATRIVDEALRTETGERRQQVLLFQAIQFALAGSARTVLDTLSRIDSTLLDAHGRAMAGLMECMAYGEFGQLDRLSSSASRASQAIASSVQGSHLRGPVTEIYVSGLAMSGRIADAVEVAGRFHRSQYSRPAAMRPVAEQIVGMAYFAAGDLIAALRHLPARFDPADWAERGFLTVHSFARFHLLRAQALARTGDTAGAADALDTARGLRHPAYQYYDSSEWLAQAWIAGAAARLDDARDAARQAAAVARELDQPVREVGCLQASVQFEDPTATARLDELAARIGTPRATAAARYADAFADDDATGLLRASEALEAMGDRLAAADAAAHSSAAYRRGGRDADAARAAARARRLAAACGGAISPALASIAAVGKLPFTRTEQEIVALVARDMPNRDIAESMSLSVRTVESHIYRAARKAGVTGRAGLRSLVEND